MRLLAFAAILLGSGVATGAAAQTGTWGGDSTSRAAEAAFVSGMTPAFKDDEIGRILDRGDARNPVQWTVNQQVMRRARDGSSVDSVRVSKGNRLRGPGGVLNLDRMGVEDEAYEVAVTRDWPAAVKFDAGGFDVDVSPHAGVGVGNLGGSAEAGATLTVAQRRENAVVDKLADMGVRDGASFGDQGRWYLFAAASGRAVGLNMLRGEDGWDRAGWSTDPSSALVGNAQVGIGWRKGAMQTSLGLIHREIKGEHMIWGQETREDSLVAFSFAIKPRR